jgi:phosphoribosylformylglycinamidine synthase PurS subunit
MLFRVRMLVELKEGLADPQCRAIMDALPAMGWDNVPWLTVGKTFHFHVEAADRDAAIRQASEMGERLLSNPVIETFTIEAVHEADVAPLRA